MASKRDLAEAQTYSRRRLLTAFTSGAPGGRELEPTKPLRGVVAGVSLSVLLVLGSLGFGMLNSGLPDGWDDQSLVVVNGDGSRYVALQGTLYPVLNVTSARLALDSSSYHVVTVDEGDIAETPRGATIGIPGAPDELPPSDRLVDTGWTACVAGDGGTALTIDPAGDPEPATTRATALVRNGDQSYLVNAGTRYRIEPGQEAAVLRALSMDTATPVEVTADWLNLIPMGTDLGPLSIEASGEPALPTEGLPADTRVGALVEVSGTGGGLRRYVVDRAGELAPLSDFAYPLYVLGAGDLAADPIRVSTADIAEVTTSTIAVDPTDWPEEAPELTEGSTPCVVLDTRDGGRVDLAFADPEAVPGTGVHVAPGSGALLDARSTAGAQGMVSLVDGTGRAHPMPEADEELLARLGYRMDDVATVPPAWAALLPTGPTLTISRASTEVTGSTEDA
ncbi:type VII secretion protein EccB [Cellulomonas sp. NPDC089187]|uniref:type VII secretion protein EccB n=1 Tax=Cellulomonas sp. NPDC089187 TaxID=3154970 RepID=UPI00342EED39